MAAFVQKPMAHNMAECYALMKAAKKDGLATQMGNQGHYSENIRRVCECVWADAIGQVTETHTIPGRNFSGSGGRPPSQGTAGGWQFRQAHRITVVPEFHFGRPSIAQH